MRVKISTKVLTGAALLCAGAMAAYAYTGEQYASHAKLTMPQARAKALAVAPGTIKDAELERETGGSGLRYSFDIKTASGLREIGIDAITGKVLEKSVESGQAEAREARAEHEGQKDRGASEHEAEGAQSGQRRGESED